MDRLELAVEALTGNRSLGPLKLVELVRGLDILASDTVGLLETSAGGSQPVNPVRLAAAVYFHDIGMMFLPEHLWLTGGKLTAEIVAQHREMSDGGGYPNHLEDDAICDGAKILAIIDAFEAVTLKHSDRGHSRSVLRAVAEVNACDNQFAAEWIAPFNSVIRHILEFQS